MSKTIGKTPSHPEGNRAMPHPCSVVFFDLAALTPTLASARLTAPRPRIGVLCNLPAGEGPDRVRTAVAAAGLEKVVEPGLIVVASGLGCSLPDPRAFAAAAAVAGVPPESCAYVS